MNKLQKFCILGRRGFLGSALEKRLGSENVSSFPTKDTKVLFNFASPVHLPFEKNPDYHINEALSGFMYLLPYCRDHGIKFVYPSSALVYEKDTVFAKFKKALEALASCYSNTLGLRIFPVYGPGENRTVIYQWCRDIKNGQRPVVYGDGEQKRDFIYIDDVVDSIIYMVEHQIEGIFDIGSGKPISFNNIIKIINKKLSTNYSPKYVKKPKDYSEGIFCFYPVLTKVGIEEGIGKVLNEIN